MEHKALGGTAVVDSGLQLWEPLELPNLEAATRDRSGSVVAQILEFLVPMHLREHNGIRAVVQAKFMDLIRGRVAGVHLSGDNWVTREGLTAQRLTIAAWEGIEINYGDLLRGRLTVVRPAQGWTETIFDPSDFGNFLVYGRVAAEAPTIAGEQIVFDREGVEFDQKRGRVYFSGRVAGATLRFQLQVGDSPRGDSVQVRVVEGMTKGPEAEVLGITMTDFFTKLQLDLAGVEMRFNALGFDSPDRLRLRLRATVHRIPNPFKDRI